MKSLKLLSPKVLLFQIPCEKIFIAYSLKYYNKIFMKIPLTMVDFPTRASIFSSCNGWLDVKSNNWSSPLPVRTAVWLLITECVSLRQMI